MFIAVHFTVGSGRFDAHMVCVHIEGVHVRSALLTKSNCIAALAVREGLSKKKASFGYYLDAHEQPRVSRTDQHYEDNGMQFVWGMEELSIDELNDLFVRVS